MIVAHALYLIAPVVMAGVIHAVVIKRDAFTLLAKPLDGGRLFRGVALFGKNKTWRGAAVMIAASTGLAATIGLPPLLGTALGSAYSLAELPNSFVKRRLGIAPGSRASRGALQYLADQGDSVLGCTLALLLFVDNSALLATVFAMGFVLHGTIDALLYVFGVKRVRELPA